VGVVREGAVGVDLLRPDGTKETLAKRGYNHFG
jgi:hypothetical protein